MANNWKKECEHTKYNSKTASYGCSLKKALFVKPRKYKGIARKHKHSLPNNDPITT
ncbi:MAG TPA: hypothetical protein VJ903_01855 [Clostridia bacterium]|nr:hypothetical protein [Clostridia bacterium]